MDKEWLDSIGKGYTSADTFAQWVNAGRPVRRAYRDEPPTWFNIADLLHENKKPKDEEQQAA